MLTVEQVISTTSARLESVMLAVHIRRDSVHMETDPRLQISMTVDCAVECRIYLNDKLCRSLKSGLSQPVSIDLPPNLSQFQLNIQSATPLDPIVSKGKMVASKEITMIRVDEALRVDWQAVQVAEFNIELMEIFGQPAGSSLGQSTASSSNNRECVICLVNIRNTVFLPCRHMCLCEQCSIDTCSRTDRCPMCRQQYESLLRISYDPLTKPFQ